MAAGTGRPGGSRASLTRGERRRLRQLAVCLVLFGLVFAGRGVDLEPVTRLTTTVGNMVAEDMDVRAVFARVEEKVTEGRAGETLRELWAIARSRGDDPAEGETRGDTEDDRDS